MKAYACCVKRRVGECVGPNRALPDVANDMNDLCGGIGDAFVNSAMPPSKDDTNNMATR